MMRRFAVLLAVPALAAGCGGSKPTPPPDHATLTGVRVHAASVDFLFDSDVRNVQVVYAHGPLAECGSGAPVRVRGVPLVIRFFPAQTRGVPKRVGGLVKTCDFEADVSWAIGLARKVPFHVSRNGATVTVSFGE